MRRLASAWNSFIVARIDPLRQALLPGRSASKRRKLEPVPNLSAASKCVWQMDREA